MTRIPLSALDLNFVRLESTTSHQVIAAVVLFDREPNWAAFEARTLHAIEIFPRLAMKIVDDSRPYWSIDSDFSLSPHVQLIRDPGISSNSDLYDVFSRLLSAGLDLQHAPWKFVVVTNAIEASSGSAAEHKCIAGAILMIHHALADGLGGFEIVDVLTAGADRRYQRNESAAASCLSPLVARPPLKDLLRVGAQMLSRRGVGVLNGASSAQRRLQFIEFPLGELRELKRRLRTSINDLYLTIISRAVQDFHQRRAGRLTDPKAIIPISLRPRSLRRSLGNQLTGVGLRLPTSLPDLRSQLAAVTGLTRQLRQGSTAAGYALLGQLNARLPRAVQSRLACACARRTNFICTHLQDRNQPRTIAEALVTANFGVPALMPEHGAAFSWVNYAAKACVTIISDPKIVPQADELLECFCRAKDEMMTL